MGNLLPQLLQTMTNDQINEALENLGRQLRATPDPSPQVNELAPALMLPPFDENAARALLSSSLPPAPAAQILSTLNQLASSGVVNVSPPPAVAMVRGPAGGKNQPKPVKPPDPIPIPWSLLTDPVAVEVLGPDVLSSLGLDPSLSPEEMLVDLAMKWPDAPVEAIQANALVTGGIHSAIQKQGDPPDGNNNGGGKTGGGTTGGGTTGGGTTTPPPNIGQEIETVIAAFARANYQSHWWGYMIGLDGAGGKAISDILMGSTAPLVLKGLTAAIAAKGGIVAALGAGATAIGPWIVVALVLYGLYLAFEISLNVDAQGVWICGIWELMIPLWAQGR